jgi:hypothetical protein
MYLKVMDCLNWSTNAQYRVEMENELLEHEAYNGNRLNIVT